MAQFYISLSFWSKKAEYKLTKVSRLTSPDSSMLLAGLTALTRKNY
jgi:hypothetical protein